MKSDGSLLIRTSFITDLWEDHKHHFLGIDSLWQDKVNNRSDDVQWLNELLEKPFAVNQARVIVRFVALHRTDSLSDYTIRWKLKEFFITGTADKQLLVQEIVYGGQVIVVLQKDVPHDSDRHECQDQLFLAAKEFFTSLADRQYRIESKIFDQVTCQYYTDVDIYPSNAISFRDYLDIHRSLFTDHDSSKWTAQEIVLRSKSDFIEPVNYFNENFKFKFRYLMAVLSDAQKQAKDILNDPKNPTLDSAEDREARLQRKKTGKY